MTAVDKAAVLRWLRRQERMERNRLSLDHCPFDRGYVLGRAHAFARTIKEVEEAPTKRPKSRVGRREGKPRRWRGLERSRL